MHSWIRKFPAPGGTLMAFGISTSSVSSSASRCSLFIKVYSRRAVPKPPWLQKILRPTLSSICRGVEERVVPETELIPDADRNAVRGNCVVRLAQGLDRVRGEGSARRRCRAVADVHAPSPQAAVASQGGALPTATASPPPQRPAF